jgi:hypothetical protein
VNAAFLLVTTAWFAGADPVPTTTGATGATGATSANAAITSTVTPHGATSAGGSCCGGSTNGGCGACCETCCQKQGCFARLKARMQRNKCCCESACDTCGSTVSTSSSCGCGGNDGCCDSGCGKHGRMRGRRHRGNECCESCGCASGAVGGYGGYGTGLGGYGTPSAMPPAGEQIKPPKDAITPGNKLPAGKPQTQAQPYTLEVTPTSSKTIETETKNPFELDRRYESRVGRAADYGWLTGQLFYVHADGGLWVLRYAPLWKEDPNGGSVILARDRQMDSYREGDLVTIHGEILNQKGSIFLGGPLYRTQSIQLIDRTAR